MLYAVMSDAASRRLYDVLCNYRDCRQCVVIPRILRGGFSITTDRLRASLVTGTGPTAGK